MFLEKGSNQCRSNNFGFSNSDFLRRNTSSKKEGKTVKKSKETIEVIEKTEKAVIEVIKRDLHICLKKVKRRKKALRREEFREKVAELNQKEMPANCLKTFIEQDERKKLGVIVTVEESPLNKDVILVKTFYLAA